MKTVNYNFDARLYGEIPLVLDAISQGDNLSRRFRVRLLDRTGAIYIIEDGTTVTFNVKKPDDKIVVVNGEIEDNRACFTLTSQALAVVGRNRCKVELVAGDQVLATQPIILPVTLNPATGDNITSTNEFQGLAEALNASEEMRKKYEEKLIEFGEISQAVTQTGADASATETARLAAEEAHRQAKTCQEKACQCATNAKNSADSAETIKGEVDTLKQQVNETAETVNGYAQDAKTAKTEAETSASAAKTSEDNAAVSATTAQQQAQLATDKADEAKTLKTDMENIRDGIVTKEQERQNAEIARVDAEKARADAEEARAAKAATQAARADEDHQQSLADQAQHQTLIETMQSFQSGQIAADVANIKQTMATKQALDDAINQLVGAAPETLDTIEELAAALQNNENIASDFLTKLEKKLDKETFETFKTTFTESLNAQLAAKATEESVASRLATKVNSSTFTTAKRELEDAIATKVEKVDGKSLSTNDFTDAYKSKVDGVEAGANKTTVINALNSDSATSALSAAQGKTLDGKITNAKSELNGNIQQLRTDLTPVMAPQETAGKPIDAKYMFDYVTAMNAVLETI